MTPLLSLEPGSCPAANPQAAAPANAMIKQTSCFMPGQTAAGA